MISSSVDDAGIAEVVVDCPPVNALPVAGWFELADALRSAGSGCAAAWGDPAWRRARLATWLGIAALPESPPSLGEIND